MPIPQTVQTLSAHPRDFHVLVGLTHYLNDLDHTPLKLAYLARQLGLSRPSISRAMRRLRTEGYVEATVTPDGTRAYRLTAKAAA